MQQISRKIVFEIYKFEISRGLKVNDFLIVGIDLFEIETILL